jgi:hypothetical protein
LIRAVRSSFDSDVPTEMKNACEFFSKVEALEYESIQFVRDRTPNALMALQDRRISTTDLLELLVKLFGHLQGELVDSVSDTLLIWGLSCGDLNSAAVAVDLWTVFHDKDVGEQVVAFLVENMSLIIECLLVSRPADVVVRSSTMYVNSGLRAISELLANGMTDKMLKMISRFVHSLLFLEDRLFDAVLINSLGVLVLLYQPGRVVLPELRPDFGTLYRRIAMHLPKELALLSSFTAALLNCPMENLGAVSDYLVAFLPTMMLASNNPQILEDSVSKFILVFEAERSFGIAQNLRNYLARRVTHRMNFLTGLFSRISELDTLVHASMFFCALYAKSEDKQSIFELATAVVTVSQNRQVQRHLIPLLMKAALEQSPETVAESANLITSAMANGLTVEMLDAVAIDRGEKIGMFEKEWLREFSAVREAVSIGLHKEFKRGGFVEISCTDVSSFPVMLAFEIPFFECECIHRITNLCRRIQSVPFSDWAMCLYKAQDRSWLFDGNDSPVNLNLSLPFQQLMDEIVEEVMNDGEDEEKNEEVGNEPMVAAEIDIFGKAEDAMKLRGVPAGKFLPDSEQLSGVMRRAISAMQGLV